MRLTLVTETFLPQVNGVSRTLSHLVEQMTRSGVTVQVVHPNYGDVEPSEARVPVRSMVLPWYKDVSLPLPPFGKVHRAIDRFAPDLVHIATEATLGFSAMAYVKRRKLPVVTSFHTNWNQYCHHYGLGFARRPLMGYLRWFHGRAAETYVPSLATIAELEGCGFRNLVLWPRGVEGDLFRPDRTRRDEIRASLGFGPDDVVIGHVSRLAAEKNVAYLAEALGVVAEARPHARFLFVGDGPARPELEALMGPKARFVGYKSGEDLADHYAAADLFAFASLTETFGNVVLEAMATGLPVVAVRAGGVGDIVQPGLTGELVDPTEPASALAAHLIKLIDDPEGRRRVAAEARLYAQSQTWGAIMGRLRDRYLAVIESNMVGRLKAASAAG